MCMTLYKPLTVVPALMTNFKRIFKFINILCKQLFQTRNVCTQMHAVIIIRKTPHVYVLISPLRRVAYVCVCVWLYRCIVAHGTGPSLADAVAAFNATAAALHNSRTAAERSTHAPLYVLYTR